MASETVDPIDWSHPPPSWAVPPERLVHSINRCSSATAGIRSCNFATFSMRGNHLASAATQGIMGLFGARWKTHSFSGSPPSLTTGDRELVSDLEVRTEIEDLNPRPLTRSPSLYQLFHRLVEPSMIGKIYNGGHISSTIYMIYMIKKNLIVYHLYDKTNIYMISHRYFKAIIIRVQRSMQNILEKNFILTNEMFKIAARITLLILMISTGGNLAIAYSPAKQCCVQVNSTADTCANFLINLHHAACNPPGMRGPSSLALKLVCVRDKSRFIKVQ